MIVPAPAMRYAAAAAVVLGIGLGGVMSWDVSSHSAQPVAPDATADPHLVYRLDALSETPSGSLAHAYLALASDDHGRGE